MEIVRKAWSDGEQRTAAVAAVDAIAGMGFVKEICCGGGVGLRFLVRDLQDLLRQVVHFDLIGDWVCWVVVDDEEGM
jgi:hypothetical protein